MNKKIVLAFVGIILLICLCVTVIGLALVFMPNSPISSTPAKPEKRIELKELGLSFAMPDDSWKHVKEEATEDDTTPGYIIRNSTNSDLVSITDFSDFAKTTEMKDISDLEAMMSAAYTSDNGGAFKKTKDLKVDNGFGVNYEIGKGQAGFIYLFNIGGKTILCETAGGYSFQFDQMRKVCETIKPLDAKTTKDTPAKK